MSSRLNNPNTEQNHTAMTMGTWRCNTGIYKHRDGRPAPKQPARSGSAGYAKIRYRDPPPGGWVGGDPEQNGYRKAAK